MKGPRAFLSLLWPSRKRQGSSSPICLLILQRRSYPCTSGTCIQETVGLGDQIRQRISPWSRGPQAAPLRQTPSPREIRARKSSGKCLTCPGKSSFCKALGSGHCLYSKQAGCLLYTDDKLRPGKWQERVQGVTMQDENGPFSPFSCIKL